MSATRSSRLHGTAKVLAVGSVLTLLAAAGCSSGKSSSAASAGDGGSKVGEAVTFGTTATPPSLNPALGDPSFGSVLQWAYDPLVVLDDKGEFQPGLATKWGYVGSGNTTYELTLRDGLKFSDGTALDAAAAKTYFDYARTQKSGSTVTLLASIASIETVDPLTVRFKLNRPDPTLTFNFAQAFGAGYMASPKAVASPKSLDLATVGTGPYMLDAAASVAGDHYAFVPNPYYWNKERQHWKRVTVRVIANPSSMVQAIKAGQIQAAVGDATTLSAARSAGLKVVAPPQALTGLDLLDRAGVIAKPLSDQRVRQALNFAVDRKAIAKALYGDEDLALSQYALSGQLGYDASLSDKYPHDPTKAKQLLAEAGYPHGFTLQVLSSPLFGFDKLTEALNGQLKEAGVTLQLVSKPDINSYITGLLGGKIPAATMAYGLANMGSLYAGFINPAGPFNPFKSTDPQLDALYKQYDAATPEEGAALEKQINARLVDLAWAVPVVGAPLSYYESSGVTGLETATAANSGVPLLTDLRPA